MITTEFLYQIPSPIRFLCTEIVLPEFQHPKKPYIMLRIMGKNFEIEMGNSPSGNIKRIVNFLQKFDTVIENTEKHVNTLSDRIDKTEKLLNEGSDLSRRVIELEKEKEELMNLLRFSDAFAQEPEVMYNN